MRETLATARALQSRVVCLGSFWLRHLSFHEREYVPRAQMCLFKLSITFWIPIIRAGRQMSLFIASRGKPPTILHSGFPPESEDSKSSSISGLCLYFLCHCHCISCDTRAEYLFMEKVKRNNRKKNILLWRGEVVISRWCDCSFAKTFILWLLGCALPQNGDLEGLQYVLANGLES